MNKAYIYESSQNKVLTNKEKAIIVLPDIYGQTEYAKSTTEELAKKFGLPTYLLDYFFQLTGQANNIGAEQAEVALSLMEKMSGQDFLSFFTKAIANISSANPNISELIVVGFCFAGRLAYLTASEPKVSKIVSFYGAGANKEFVAGQTSIEYLIEHADKNRLKIVSFYGTTDESIPEADRMQTKTKLEQAGINYIAKEYQANHAYFQPGRPNYNEDAANISWTDLRQFIGE